MMRELIIPNDYDILKPYVNEINGNDSEMEILHMGLERDNKKIIGYMVVDKSQKASCLGDGIIKDGKDNKPYIEDDGVLGRGMYFYEYNYIYARDLAKYYRKDIVGAVISLDNVFDFTDGTAIYILDNNKEKFEQYVEQKIQEYNQNLQSLKNPASNSIKRYRDEISRLRIKKFIPKDYFDYFEKLSKQQKQYKFDAVRFCNMQGDNQFCNMPKYQAIQLYMLNHKKIEEYFNPLNKQDRNEIIKKYFSKETNRK